MCIENREEWCGACAQREGEHALKEVSTKGASSLQFVEKGGGIILGERPMGGGLDIWGERGSS